MIGCLGCDAVSRAYGKPMLCDTHQHFEDCRKAEIGFAMIRERNGQPSNGVARLVPPKKEKSNE